MRQGHGSRGRRGDTGASAVEFAIIFAAIVAPLTLGILQYGWYFYTSQTSGAAVRDTARRLSVGDCWTGTQATTYAQGHANLRDLTLTVTPADPAVGDVVTVTGTLPATAQLFEFFPLPGDGVVQRVVQVRMEDEIEGPTCS